MCRCWPFANSSLSKVKYYKSKVPRCRYILITLSIYVCAHTMPGASTRMVPTNRGSNATGTIAEHRTEGARARWMAIPVKSRNWIPATAGATRSARGSWASKKELTQVALSRVPKALHAQVFSTGNGRKRVPVIGGNAGGQSSLKNADQTVPSARVK
jgi:hypothetical protein